MTLPDVSDCPVIVLWHCRPTSSECTSQVRLLYVNQIQVESFFAKYPDAGAGVMARKQAVDRIKSNIAWMKANEQQVSSWLDANGYV